MSQLPLDVLISILGWVPPTRDRRETGALTLLNCLCVNSLFREAASLSSIWKPHYETRYEHWVEENERGRRGELGNNWRRMYTRRREIDNAALQLLDKIVVTRVGIQDVAISLVRQSLDVWDVLELECTCPVPDAFKNQTTEVFEGDSEPIPDDAICRRFWAGHVRDTIARGYGVSLWRRFIPHSSSPPLEMPSFELTMSSMSTMFGMSDKMITRRLDILANLCRRDLIKKEIPLDYHHPDYNLARVCKEICLFMRQKGFSHYVHEPWFEQDSWKILDKFPHAYLTTNRSTIPISLIHVFVAIATRLDIDACPVNFPRVVLSYVRSREQTDEHVIVNPSALDPSNSVIEADTPYNDNPIQQVQTFASQFLTINPIPCDAATMLIRACRNIAVAIPRHHATRPEVHSAVLLPLCVNLIFQAENNTLQELFETADLRPLDCIFLLDELAPYLAPRCKRILEGVCRSVIARDAQAAEKESRRKPGTIQFFVGMAFIHTQYEYMGFIFSWDEKCMASDDWIGHMGVDKLPRGKNQPFYEVFAVDGTVRYVAEENIKPATFTKEHVKSLYRNFDLFAAFFEGADYPRDFDKGVEHRDGRGRLLLSPHKREAYPDDTAFGAQWVENGFQPT